MMAQSASSMVAGNSDENSLSTGSCVIIDLPRSPCRTRDEIDPVLDDDRLVEAVFLAQLLVAGGIDAALAGKRFDGIARYEADQEESQQRDPDEGRDDQADAGENESEHRLNVKRRSGFFKPLRRRLKGLAYLPLMSTP